MPSLYEVFPMCGLHSANSNSGIYLGKLCLGERRVFGPRARCRPANINDTGN
jgi:hypothetical protein